MQSGRLDTARAFLAQTIDRKHCCGNGRDWPWKAILLAPWGVPLACSAVLALALPGKSPVLTFLITLALGLVFSYAATMFMLLPSFFILCRWVPLSAAVTSVVGLALGISSNLPLVWVSYRSSGDDSGPPTETFLDYLLRQSLGWEMFALPVAGLFTALLFWLLAPRTRVDSGQLS